MLLSRSAHKAKAPAQMLTPRIHPIQLAASGFKTSALITQAAAPTMNRDPIASQNRNSGLRSSGKRPMQPPPAVNQPSPDELPIRSPQQHRSESDVEV